MLVASFLLYTLSVSFLANILCIFRVPTALHMAWGSFVSIRSNHDDYADPLRVAFGDLSSNHTSSIDGSAVHVVNGRVVTSSLAIRFPSGTGIGVLRRVMSSADRWSHWTTRMQSLVLSQSQDAPAWSDLFLLGLILCVLSLLKRPTKRNDGFKHSLPMVPNADSGCSFQITTHQSDEQDTGSATDDNLLFSMGLVPSPSHELQYSATGDHSCKQIQALSDPLFFTSKIVASPPPIAPTTHHQILYTPSRAETVDDGGWHVQTRRRKGKRHAAIEFELALPLEVHEEPVSQRKAKKRRKDGKRDSNQSEIVLEENSGSVASGSQGDQLALWRRLLPCNRI